MNNLFDRLTIKVPQATRLKILRNNISPFYQTQLALTLNDITSTEKLLKLGRKLEARKSAVEMFNHPPSRKSNMLEPDLAYVEANFPQTTTSTNIDELHARKQIICYNCNKPGHVANVCNEPLRRHRYRCKKPKFTTRTCPDCNQYPGNGERRH